MADEDILQYKINLETKAAQSALSSLKSSMGMVSAATTVLSSSISIFTGALGLLTKVMLGTFNLTLSVIKQLSEFDDASNKIARTMQVYGVTLKTNGTYLKELSREYGLSVIQTHQLTQSFQQLLPMLPPTEQNITKISQAMASKFGPGIKDIERGMKNLGTVLTYNSTLNKQLNKDMELSGSGMRALYVHMREVGGLSKEQADEMMTSVMPLALLTSEQKKLNEERAQSVTLQNQLNAAFANIKLAVLKMVGPIFTEIGERIKTISRSFEDVAQGLKGNTLVPQIKSIVMQVMDIMGKAIPIIISSLQTTAEVAMWCGEKVMGFFGYFSPYWEEAAESTKKFRIEFSNMADNIAMNIENLKKGLAGLGDKKETRTQADIMADNIKNIYNKELGVSVTKWEDIRARTENASKQQNEVISGLQKQVEYLNKGFAPLSEYSVAYDEQIFAVRELVKLEQEKIDNQIGSSKEAYDSAKKAYDAIKTIAGKEKEAAEFKKAMDDALAENNLSKQSMIILQGKKRELQTKEIEMIVAKTTQYYQKQLEFQRASTSLAESEMSLAEKMNFGIGVTIQQRAQVIQQVEKERAIIEQEIISTQQQIKQAGENANLRRQLEFQLKQQQTERINLLSKEVDMTKELREGYLQAMEAFDTGAGRFEKIIKKQDMGTRELMRTTGAAGAMALGGIGTGLTAPSMQYTAAGLQQTAKINDAFLKGAYGTQSATVNINALAATGKQPGTMFAAGTEAGRAGIYGGGMGAASGEIKVSPTMQNNMGAKIVEGGTRAADGTLIKPTAEAAAGGINVVINMNGMKFESKGTSPDDLKKKVLDTITEKLNNVFKELGSKSPFSNTQPTVGAGANSRI